MGSAKARILDLRGHERAKISMICISLFFFASLYVFRPSFNHVNLHRRPLHAEQLLQTCADIKLIPGPPSDFSKRTESDRWVPGTRATLIVNATVWVGRSEGTYEGLIVKVGHVVAGDLPKKYDVINANGSWVTPGIFDMHSHIGVYSSPELRGAQDGNSLVGPINPWLRSLDGLNTHDDSYRLSIAGGVTTSLILPGSADAIGGQAYVIKLRSTAERSPSSMLLEPPFTMNSSASDPLLPHRWRHMKHACGENPSRVYGYSRMDTQWSFRQAYNEARKIKKKQDEYCEKIEAGLWNDVPNDFPYSLQWEALVDVLRGKVKVNNHCYEAVDFDQQIRLTNEFKFSIVAFHHAHEAYLVPDLLKKMYGKPPAIALFATNGRYKREAYRGSEFAPRILSDAGFQVVMKSDHPVLDSRFLLYEAQQAHYYGLDHDLALASVTTTPAELQGFGHRLGYVKAGYDADIVIWDSHPLALGATPKQVFIDGIPQLEKPYTTEKPSGFQVEPKVPNFDKEAEAALEYDGLPPLLPSKETKSLAFLNVRKIYEKDTAIRSQFVTENGQLGTVVVVDGHIVCKGLETQCGQFMDDPKIEKIDLEDGVLAPGMLTFGAPIGLVEIDQEASTKDGVGFAPLKQPVPSILGSGFLPKAVDGLQFRGRDTLLAFRNGVTKAVVAPVHSGFLGGLSVAFSTGSVSRLAKGAIVKDIAALHVTIVDSSKQPSVSTQIGLLRDLLSGNGEGPIGDYFSKAAEGKIRLVAHTQNSDVIATLLDLIDELAQSVDAKIKLTIAGGAEAHHLAEELGQAGVGVILTRPRPFPTNWPGKDILPGLPLSSEGQVTRLLAHNVTVGLGIEESWQARNLWFDAAWAAIEAGGNLDKETALGLVSTNLETLLGVDVQTQPDLVAWKGGDVFDLSSKVVAIVSGAKGLVDIL
ncbi:SubName: Full=Related to carbohydrate esterase family 9 protein-Laccaria bicolor {ECO:0000313/EMBL:CCA72748.1} [Serendipita indica DSM 11827]|nr:SubName: Full=Related to carbohydrate esterase family 9 protein-Laccaria bicolor {ECO:0000313/EMBL:CCA72748.1} [Serendipita indica DSM 11827]